MMYCIIMKLAALTCMPVLIVIYNSMNCYGQRDVSRVTTWVSRRSIDFYRHSGDKSHTICELEDPTFMVDERNCTNNEDILNRCSFVLTENYESILLVHIHSSQGLIVVDRNQPKNMNSSWCQIISLEVYRGKNESIEVKRSGFILTDNNIFEIDKTQLAYDIQEYEGELFRANISCSFPRRSESECFFFKVWGQTNLTESKFNCTVPGTLYDYSIDCPPKPMTSATQTTANIISNSTLATAVTATNLTVLNKRQPSKFEVGSRLFYIVVGVGGGTATLLIFCLCCVCVVLICRQQRIKVSAITSTEMERRISTVSRQTEAKNEKDTDLELYIHMYAVPSEVIRSNINTYRRNYLEDNPSYLKPGDCSKMSHGKSEEMLECSYAIIPAEKGLDLQCDYDGNKEEPLYQEIIPRAELKSSLPQSKETCHSVITAENDFYQTSLHLQHQWKEDCMPSGRPKPFQTFHHFKQ